MEHDRTLYPRSEKNSRGELVFDLHPAKMLLREDLKNGLHKRMSPSALRRTREEYKAFGKSIFKHRIYQELARQKMINWLEKKRCTRNRWDAP
jgi:hypothetical protein